MWRAYEAGSSVPGGNVLEALVRLGFNANWILTGEGEMRRAVRLTESEAHQALKKQLIGMSGAKGMQAHLQTLGYYGINNETYRAYVYGDYLPTKEELEGLCRAAGGWSFDTGTMIEVTNGQPQTLPLANCIDEVKKTLLTILDAIESAETSNLCPISSLSPKERTALIYAMLVYAEDLMDNCELSKREIYSVVPLAFSIVKRYEEMQESAKSTDKGIWETNLGKLLDAVLYVFGAKEI